MKCRIIRAAGIIFQSKEQRQDYQRGGNNFPKQRTKTGLSEGREYQMGRNARENI